MTSLLAKSALDKLPPEVRDHIIVENETGYSITLSMTIGDFERLVAPHAAVEEFRRVAERATEEARHANEAADEANAERDDLLLVLDEAILKTTVLRDEASENGTPITVEDMDELLEVLDL